MTTNPDALRDEIELLDRSLRDAADEHERGDLDDVDLAAIRDRDGARLAAARARLASFEEEQARPRGAATAGTGTPATHDGAHGTNEVAPGVRRRPRWLLVVAGVCAAAIVLVLVNPFHQAPAPVRVTPATKLEALLILGQQYLRDSQPARALTAFDAARRLAPTDPEALIESGWLRFEFGAVAKDRAEEQAGAASLRLAVRVAPDVAAGHLYDAIVLLRFDHDRAAALAQARRSGELIEDPTDETITQRLIAYLTG